MDIQETETTPEELEEISPEETQNNVDQDPRDHLHIEWAGYI